MASMSTSTNADRSIGRVIEIVSTSTNRFGSDDDIIERIPVPRRSAIAAMASLAQALGNEGAFLPILQSETIKGLRLPDVGVILLGTGCHRPLLCEEAQELRDRHGDHVILVRMEDERVGLGPYTLDVLLAGRDRWFVRHKPWQIHPTADLWIVPCQGEGSSIRIVAKYLAVSPRAPFSSLFEREHGFKIAAEKLSLFSEAK